MYQWTKKNQKQNKIKNGFKKETKMNRIKKCIANIYCIFCEGNTGGYLVIDSS